MNTSTNVSIAEIAGFVRRGADLLDEMSPGWWTKINLDRLNQDSTTNCVLGQVFGKYADGKEIVFGNRYASADLANSHGFAALNSWDYPPLTDEWQRFIRTRRINGDVDKTNEEAVLDAARKGIVDLYLLATGRPESDRFIVTALLG